MAFIQDETPHACKNQLKREHHVMCANIDFEVNNAPRRRRRAEHSANIPRQVPNLPLACQVVDGTDSNIQHVLPRMSVRCSTCRALH